MNFSFLELMTKNCFIMLGGAVALFFSSCKKEQVTVTQEPSVGRFTFLQEELDVQVTPSVNSVVIPIRLTRPEKTKTLTANILLGNGTTAVNGVQFQMQPQETSGSLNAYQVAHFAPGDTAALFSMLIFPDEIKKPETVELFIPDAYFPQFMDEIIHTVKIRLNPAQ